MTITASLELTIVAMAIVFVVLIGLTFLLTLIAKVVKKQPSTPVQPPVSNTPAADSLDLGEEGDVAMLMALVLANEDAQEKHYEVVEIKRVR